MRLGRGVTLVLLSLALATAAGCGRRDIRLLPATEGSGGSSDGSAAGSVGGGSVDGALAETSVACTGLGAPVLVPAPGGATCAAALAARVHAFALCVCGALGVTARVRSDAFDSSGAVVDDGAASVGINGGLQTTAEVRAGGAIHVAGALGIRAGDHVQAGRSLRVGGPFSQLDSNADVAGDAYSAGDLSGDVRIQGVLHVAAGATVAAGVRAASVLREPVSVPAPCPCDTASVDVAAAVASAAARNDNASASLPSAITVAAATPATLSLPCGTFYVTGVDARGPLTIAVHGHALLAVGGDVTVRAGLTIMADPGAELDLLVGGALQASGGVIGSASSPAAFRIWMAAGRSVVLDGTPTLGAVLTAPTSSVTAPAGLELRGALLAGILISGGEIGVHFDQAILAGGRVCGEAVVPAPL